MKKIEVIESHTIVRVDKYIGVCPYCKDNSCIRIFNNTEDYCFTQGYHNFVDKYNIAKKRYIISLCYKHIDYRLFSECYCECNNCYGRFVIFSQRKVVNHRYKILKRLLLKTEPPSNINLFLEG
jgi:hypothetical protein